MFKLGKKKRLNDHRKAKSGGTLKKNLSILKDELQDLDFQDFPNWSIQLKVAAYSTLFLLSSAASIYFLASPVMDEIQVQQDERTRLLSDYEMKRIKLSSSQQYEKQYHHVENIFNYQLNLLPKETEIAGLVDDINNVGRKSMLSLNDIQLESELEKEIFIEQPILIKATGDFHAFGDFASQLSALPRIVTIQDFTISTVEAKDQKGDIPKLTYTIKASTYRYLTNIKKKKTGVKK